MKRYDYAEVFVGSEDGLETEMSRLGKNGYRVKFLIEAPKGVKTILMEKEYEDENDGL